MAQSMQIKGRVIIYTVHGCPSCVAAKNRLARLGVPYVEVNLDDYESQERQTLVNRTGKRSMPQIFFNGIFVGGYDDLATLKNDELQALVDEVIHYDAPPTAPVVPCIGAITMGSSLTEHRDRDQYAPVVEDLARSGLIQTHRRGIMLYRKTFVAEEFVQWLSLNEKYSYDHQEARAVGEELLRRKFIRRLTPEGDHHQFRADAMLYRLLDDEEWEALNAGPVSLNITREAVELSKALQVLMKKIYAQYISSGGKTVDYLGIARDPNFKIVESVAYELQRARLETLSKEETTAFFINIYNCIVIHWNVRMGSPGGLLSRGKFFFKARYILGGELYSLGDIENGILRANSKCWYWPFRPFSKEDPRLVCAVLDTDPRIHFALVCGARSCPAICCYTSEDIDTQLDMATDAYLEGHDGCQVDVENKVVTLSRIFKWYKEDFGASKSQVLQWIYNHMGHGEKRQLLGDLLEEGTCQVTYMKYDWASNGRM
ncbi:uncharacterized protein LOC118408141 [Branchiostoma floridae]|uniref:Uncharacterized protein LOC118408141 n=1 Tax=Branchiostoma floridae TaxID=7739 RepID=A0A9J7HRX4_BRAFL|nr:uncharacterized protein LOC118408141 [Branchiostoma floridae]